MEIIIPVTAVSAKNYPAICDICNSQILENDRIVVPKLLYCTFWIEPDRVYFEKIVCTQCAKSYFSKTKRMNYGELPLFLQQLINERLEVVVFTEDILSIVN